jgi:hypothetical protein
MTRHVATIRKGIVGPGEPGHRVFEGNYVMECTCGLKLHMATDPVSAERRRADHERTGR